MEERPHNVLSSLWLPLAFLMAGLLIGLQLNFTVPQEYASYTAVALLAALDSIFGAIRAELDGTYSNRIFISGLLTNTALAAGLTFLSDRLGGVDLSIAAVVAFGVRLFNNLAVIRRMLLGRSRSAAGK